MTNLFIIGLAATLASYLIGSLSSAIIVAKLWGLPDPRTGGSKNPGATNMLRLGGKLPALFTLLGDTIKGFIPVYSIQLYFSKIWFSKSLIAKLLAPQFWGIALFPLAGFSYIEGIISVVFIAAVLGHLYPLFFQFKGGKGVATALGGLLGLSLALGLSFIGIWLVIAFIFRYSSLAALVAISGVSIIACSGVAPYYTPAIVIVAVLLFWRHRENIRNLLRGSENKIGQSGRRV